MFGEPAKGMLRELVLAARTQPGPQADAELLKDLGGDLRLPAFDEKIFKYVKI